MAELDAIPAVRETVPGERHLGDLLDDMLLLGDSLVRFLDAVANEAGVDRAELVATDDNLVLEYATPRGNVLPWSTASLLQVSRTRHGPSAPLLGNIATISIPL